MSKQKNQDPPQPADLQGSYLGMESMHTVLGTEPANGPLTAQARAYSDDLAALADAIEGEQAAIFSEAAPTYRLDVAMHNSSITRQAYLREVYERQVSQYRGRGPQSIPEETT